MAKLLPTIGNNISLTEKAYLVIKNAILNNKLKPREILSEEALAAELGISRTPVRAALKKLEFERLILLNPGRNAIVADFSEEDMCQVFPIRIALEPVAARIAAQNINKDDLKKLKEILTSQQQAVQMEDYNLYIQKDFEFHTALARFSKNELLSDMVETINTQIKRFLILSVTLQENSTIAIQEHLKVVEALEQGEQSLAEELMKEHVVGVANRILKKNEF